MKPNSTICANELIGPLTVVPVALLVVGLRAARGHVRLTDRR